MQSQNNNVAVLTGGAGGIGAATALTLAQRGFRVAIVDLDGDAAGTTAARIRGEGHEVLPVQGDITDEASVKAMVDAVLATWGRIDVLINNAGIESMKPFLEIGVAEYEQVMRVNTTGAWICCQAIIPLMQKQQGGSIVNVSSVAGQRGGGLLGTAAYSTSKGAVIALTKALAREFARFNVRVNAVSPALTMTELAQRQLDRAPAGMLAKIEAMTPLGRAAQPNEIAAVIAFLASNESSYVTGHVYNVDGGSAM